VASRAFAWESGRLGTVSGLRTQAGRMMVGAERAAVLLRSWREFRGLNQVYSPSGVMNLAKVWSCIPEECYHQAKRILETFISAIGERSG
jgi:hypothetical protein